MSVAAREFLEEEFAGVQGVRGQELFVRAQGLDYDELMAALKEFPVVLKKHPFPEGDHYEWRHWTRLTLEQALRRLVGYPEWSEFFVELCEARRLESQAWQFKDELSDRGTAQRLDDVQDALFDLARELMPESPAAAQTAYEDWAGGLLRQMFNLLHERGLEGPDGEDADRIDEAYATGARARLRAAARGYAMKALEERQVA